MVGAALREERTTRAIPGDISSNEGVSCLCADQGAGAGAGPGHQLPGRHRSPVAGRARLQGADSLRCFDFPQLELPTISYKHLLRKPSACKCTCCSLGRHRTMLPLRSLGMMCARRPPEGIHFEIFRQKPQFLRVSAEFCTLQVLVNASLSDAVATTSVEALS